MAATVESGAKAPARAYNRTPPEVEARVVELARAGKSRREVMAETGVGRDAVSRIVREAGVQWGHPPGSSGTPGAMDRARGVQSQYARNRRAAIADRILDETERTLDLMEKCLVPRDRALLAQTLSHSGKAYADLTVLDAKAAPDTGHIKSMFDAILESARRATEVTPIQAGVIIRADGATVTPMGPNGGTIEE